MKSFFTTKVLNGFDSVKVKAQCKMAIERLKLIRSKRVNNVKTQRRGLAELLAIGKYDSARVTVEGCIREDVSIEGLEVLSLMLELLTNRMQLIVESKPTRTGGKKDASSTCPPELKEAVTSVLWASARVGADVPELSALRKAFESKFGKHFVEMATGNEELSVNQQIIDRLNMYTVPNEKCLAYLTSIAQEYNITNFDPQKLIDPNGLLASAGTTTGLDGVTLRRESAGNGDAGAGLDAHGADALLMNEPADMLAAEGMLRTPSGLIIPATTKPSDEIDQRIMRFKLIM